MRDKTPIWKAIANALRDDLVQGRYVQGDKIPTEASLADRFGVNRHTVRHALSHLIEEGLLRSRRGSGVFVTAQPTEYPIGTRVRFHENLLAAGRIPDKKVLSVEVRQPSEGEKAALKGTERVCAYHGLSRADGQPIALFESVFPLDRLPGLDLAFQEVSSVTEALKRVGVTDFTRASTHLTAIMATATHALHLHISEGSPVLRTTNLNVDPEGTPIEYGRTYFASERVTLTV
ncbi:MAG: phosphonate metabolism transcriptional regulator PhnF [Rhodobacteraceae bacterium]|nr:phosphonate metabolism transcriptional regulator PhnF [Paracoccaceae bacterium]